MVSWLRVHAINHLSRVAHPLSNLNTGDVSFPAQTTERMSCLVRVSIFNIWQRGQDRRPCSGGEVSPVDILSLGAGEYQILGLCPIGLDSFQQILKLGVNGEFSGLLCFEPFFQDQSSAAIDERLLKGNY